MKIICFQEYRNISFLSSNVQIVGEENFCFVSIKNELEYLFGSYKYRTCLVRLVSVFCVGTSFSFTNDDISLK
jgi:hypothetical protein